jgi:hypothetical protein
MHANQCYRLTILQPPMSKTDQERVSPCSTHLASIIKSSHLPRLKSHDNVQSKQAIHHH